MPDPALFVGQTSVEESGDALAVDERRAQGLHAGGTLLYDNTWYSSYRGEPRIVHVGTKPRPVAAAEEGAERPERAERPDRPDRRQPLRSAISSASQPGTRVGRCVVASTQAWRVQPSATFSPSRSTE